MRYYENKKVLITGASSGIGAAFSRQLAKKGAQLIVTARREDRLRQLADELQMDRNTKVMVIPCDLSDPAGPKTLFRRLMENNIEVDILINNAGFGYNGPFEEEEAEVYDKMMQVNMSALVGLTRLLLPDMLARKTGGILNVASMAGFLPIPYFSVYSATKQFVINFSWSLWRELRGTGVHVCVLCPGPVDTGFQQVAGISKKKVAFRSLQSPESVARKGLMGLSKNKGMQLSRPLLRILYLMSKYLPLKFGLMVGRIAMKK